MSAELALNPSVRARLAAMMFLQFFVWGAWFVTLSTYLGQNLGFAGSDIGSAYATMPWGAIVAPFVVGMIADRFFAAERVLGVLHLVGAVLLWAASSTTDPGALFWVLLGYALCYNPTLALVNAISFNQMTSPEKQFPAIRVFGTVGWILAGLLVGFLKLEATATPLKIAAVCSAVLGVFSFVLPHTPPKSLGRKVTVRDVLGLDALQLLKERSFAVFVLGSLLVCIPLSFYYSFTNLFLNEQGVVNAAGKMTMGQMSEVFFMLVMPFFFVRLGREEDDARGHAGLVGALPALRLRQLGRARGHVLPGHPAARDLLRLLLRDRPDLRGQHGAEVDPSERPGLHHPRDLRGRDADRGRDLGPHRRVLPGDGGRQDRGPRLDHHLDRARGDGLRHRALVRGALPGRHPSVPDRRREPQSGLTVAPANQAGVVPARRPVDSRTHKDAAKPAMGEWCPLTRATIARTAAWPISKRGWLTVVSGGQQ